MEKKVYITEEERAKCRKVIDAFAELYEIEDADILLVDAGRHCGKKFRFCLVADL